MDIVYHYCSVETFLNIIRNPRPYLRGNLLPEIRM